MASWRILLSDLAEFGVSYFLPSESSGDYGAFAIRTHEQFPGSIDHPDGGAVMVFANACTHMGCVLVEDGVQDIVSYARDAQGTPARLTLGPCPCHATSYDLSKSGLVTLGPASQDLPQMQLGIEGGELVATAVGAVDPRVETWPA